MNDFIFANRSHPQKGNKMKRDAQNTVVLYALQKLRKIHINRPVVIHYRFYEPNKRRDLDNVSGFFHKVCQDALVEAGILKNDGWNEIKGYTDEFFVDNKNPRIEVELIEQE